MKLMTIVLHLQHSQKDDNLEFTRCQAGNIETSNIQDVSVNMNMTRCYQNWGQENSKMFSTSRNESNFQVKDQVYKGPVIKYLLGWAGVIWDGPWKIF